MMVHVPLLTLCFISLFCLGLIENSRAAAYPLILQDFGISNMHGALFFGLSSGCHMLSTLTSRWWLPALRPVYGLFIWLLCAALSLVLLGTASWFEVRMAWLVVLLGVMFWGAAMGGLAICQNALVPETVSPIYRRRAFSGLHTMYGLSALIAPLWVGQMHNWGLGWGRGFLGLAFLPFMLSGFAWVLFKKNQRLVAKSVSTEAAQSTHPSTVLQCSQPETYELQQWVIAITLGVYVMAEMGLSTRLVLMGVQEGGLTPMQAGLNLSLFFLALTVGRLLMSGVTLPFASLQILFVSASSSLLVLVVSLVYWPELLPFTGLTMAPFFPTSMALAAEQMPSKVESSTSLIMFLQGLSLVVLHQSLGWLESTYSVRAALWLCPATLLVCIFGLIWLAQIEKSPLQREKQAV